MSSSRKGHCTESDDHDQRTYADPSGCAGGRGEGRDERREGEDERVERDEERVKTSGAVVEVEAGEDESLEESAKDT